MQQQTLGPAEQGAENVVNLITWFETVIVDMLLFVISMLITIRFRRIVCTNATRQSCRHIQSYSKEKHKDCKTLYVILKPLKKLKHSLCRSNPLGPQNKMLEMWSIWPHNVFTRFLSLESTFNVAFIRGRRLFEAGLYCFQCILTNNISNQDTGAAYCIDGLFNHMWIPLNFHNFEGMESLSMANS